MRRLGAVLFALALVLSACGGRASEPTNSGEGVAALDEVDAGADTNANDEGDKGNKKTGSAGDKSGADHKSGGKQKASGPSSSSGNDSAPAGTSSDSSGGSKAAPRAAQATPAVPIPGGTHSYDTDGSSTVSGNERRMPKTTTLTARAARSSGEQTQIRDLRDEDGNGTVVETRLVYREEGVYITYVKITATFPGGFTDVRELEPSKPELIAPTGPRPGSNASFSMEGSGTRADFDIRAKRFENITIGGSTVKTLVVDTKIVFSGAYEGQQVSTSWFYNKNIMALKENVATDVTNGPIRVQSQYQATLTRLP